MARSLKIAAAGGVTTLLLLALSLTADAQTMTGLPELKITLAGSAQPPLQIINSGEHSIAGIVLAITFAGGGPPAPWRGMIVPGIIPPDSAQHTLYIPMPGPDVTAVALDGVVFDDGTYAGPDTTNSFEDMKQLVADSAAVAAPLVSATSDKDFADAWVTISEIVSRKDGEAPFTKRAAAHILLGRKADGGNAAAKEAAQIFVKLAPLTRGK